LVTKGWTSNGRPSNVLYFKNKHGRPCLESNGQTTVGRPCSGISKTTTTQIEDMIGKKVSRNPHLV